MSDREMRARRAPIAIALVFFWEIAWALIIATPVHAWARRAWGAHPEGDAVLFDPTGRALAAWIAGGDDAVSVVVRTTLFLVVVGAIVGQIPLAALVASLVRPHRPAAAVAVGVRAWLPLLGLMVLAGAVQGVVLMLGGLAASSLERALRESVGDARSSMVRLAVLGLFVLGAAMVGVVVDLGRVAIARHVAERDPDEGPEPGLGVLRRGLSLALGTSRRAFGRAAFAWAWRASAATLLLVVGAWAGDLVGGRGGFGLFALFGFHQLVALGRTALRASWLANALRLVAAHARPES